jgi:Uma2 family endonuclease
MTLSYNTDIDRALPDSDGKPMSDNTEQFCWIVLIKENLEVLFRDNADVFVAGDLLWYPEKSRIIPPVAPDVMVVFGRPKGKRGSYRQWRENNIAPQVVFALSSILKRSPSNSSEEMDSKLEYYNTYGVEEYYLYDPDSDRLDGWLRQGEALLPIVHMDNWISPRLGIRFDPSGNELAIYRPDGQLFLSSVQKEQQLERERKRAEQAEIRAEQLAEYLRSLGINPDDLPQTDNRLGTSKFKNIQHLGRTQCAPTNVLLYLG